MHKYKSNRKVVPLNSYDLGLKDTVINKVIPSEFPFAKRLSSINLPKFSLKPRSKSKVNNSRQFIHNFSRFTIGKPLK